MEETREDRLREMGRNGRAKAKERAQAKEAKRLAIEAQKAATKKAKEVYAPTYKARQATYRAKQKAKPFAILQRRLDKFTEGTDNVITVEQVLAKFGLNPVCYLTGDLIDYHDGATYHLDHRIPKSKGGACDLDNLELASPESNYAKHVLSLEEFVTMCRKVVARLS